MSEWQSTEIQPARHMFKRPHPGDWLEVRVLVAIEGIDEVSKGTCFIRSNGDLHWRADGFIGDWNITHWRILPDPPNV